MRKVVSRSILRAALALIASLAVVTLAAAQADVKSGEVKKSPFGVGPSGPAPIAGPAVPGSPPIAAPTGSGGVWGWLMATQQRYQREMATAVRELKTANPIAAAASLAFISFMYGVLHAAGPGHGKAVISSYVLANRQTMRRGIALSFLSAFFQACSAILLVGALVLAVKATSLQMRAAESWIEIVSWALVALVGVWLLYRQVAPMVAHRRTVEGGAHTHHHNHSHETAPLAAAHVHSPGCGHDHAHAAPTSAPAHVHGPGCGHDHSHDDHAAVPAAHVHDASCGHVHMPEPSQLEGPWSWSRAISLAMTVGIRPCSGAILVLLFTLSQGLLWAGVFATFMMSLGTALTVSALAALAVGSRDLAVRMAGADSPWAARLQTFAGIAGAVLVILLGSAGFLASLRGPAPF
jgi:nickel/cobalt transporter (NicO) family protein